MKISQLGHRAFTGENRVRPRAHVDTVRMRPSRTTSRVHVLLQPLALVGVVTLFGACARFIPFPPVDCHISAAQLEERYASRWIECDEGCSPHRELVQLGIPSRKTMALWHKLDTEMHGNVLRPTASEVPRITIYTTDGKAVTDAKVQRIDCNGRTLESGARPGADCFFAERIEVSNLAPDTSYVVGVGRHRLRGRTAPEQSPTVFSLLATSCNNPYAGGRNGALPIGRVNSLSLFEARATGDIRYGVDAKDGVWPAQPTVHVGLGDQVYVDGDNEAERAHLALFQGSDSTGVFDPRESLALLGTIYDYHMAIPTWDRALYSVPSAFIWDDHEVRDGWKSRRSDTTNLYARYYGAATAAYRAYEALRNPRSSTPTEKELSLDVQFDWGSQIHVYLPDGRSNRARPSGHSPGRIFDPKQHAELKRWLAASAADDRRPHVFFVGLPSTITMARPSPPFGACGPIVGSRALSPESEDDLADSFLCNPTEAKALLDIFKEHFVDHRPQDVLIVLAGDVHMSSISALVTAPGKRDSGHLIGYEVTSSGIANDAAKSGVAEILLPSGAELTPGIHAYGMGTIRNAPSFAEIRVRFDSGAPIVDVVTLPSAQSRRSDPDAWLANRSSALRSEGLIETSKRKTEDVRFASSCQDGDLPAQPAVMRVELSKRGSELPVGVAEAFRTNDGTTDPCVEMHQRSVHQISNIPKRNAAASWRP